MKNETNTPKENKNQNILKIENLEKYYGII